MELKLAAAELGAGTDAGGVGDDVTGQIGCCAATLAPDCLSRANNKFCIACV